MVPFIEESVLHTWTPSSKLMTSSASFEGETSGLLLLCTPMLSWFPGLKTYHSQPQSLKKRQKEKVLGVKFRINQMTDAFL